MTLEIIDKINNNSMKLDDLKDTIRIGSLIPCLNEKKKLPRIY